jgi:hypothetical protein
MATKRTHNEAYWDMLAEKQVKEEYARWLAEKGRANDPHTAQLFAMEKIAGGFDYMGIKERDLIILLAGRLPYMYD